MVTPQKKQKIENTISFYFVNAQYNKYTGIHVYVCVCVYIYIYIYIYMYRYITLPHLRSKGNTIA